MDRPLVTGYACLYLRSLGRGEKKTTPVKSAYRVARSPGEALRWVYDVVRDLPQPDKGGYLDDQFQGMPAEGVGWAAAEATARRSGGGLPALVVEVAAGGQASGSTSGCVNRTGLPSDRA